MFTNRERQAYLFIEASLITSTFWLDIGENNEGIHHGLQFGGRGGGGQNNHHNRFQLNIPKEGTPPVPLSVFEGTPYKKASDCSITPPFWSVPFRLSFSFRRSPLARPFESEWLSLLCNMQFLTPTIHLTILTRSTSDTNSNATTLDTSTPNPPRTSPPPTNYPHTTPI